MRRARRIVSLVSLGGAHNHFRSELTPEVFRT